MPKKITFEDNAVRLVEVKSAVRETRDKRLYERYHCIHLLLITETQKNIAKLINRGVDTVGNYVQAYGIDSLIKNKNILKHRDIE